MNAIWALAIKDLKLLMRDKVGFFFVFFFPLIYAIFFGTIFSDQGGGFSAISVVVVDEDNTEQSKSFVKKLTNASELKVITADRQKAMDLVRKGKKTAYILLAEGFGASQDLLFGGQGLRLEVGVDPARRAEAGMLQGVIMQYSFQIFQDLFTNRSMMKDQVKTALSSIKEDGGMDPITSLVLTQFLTALDIFVTEMPQEEKTQGSEGEGLANWNPVQVEFKDITVKREGPKSSFDITLPQAFAWVFLGCSAAFAISLVVERVRGTLLRLRCSSISLHQILAGKSLACFITIMGALILLFVFFYLVFGVRAQSMIHLLLAFACSSFAFVGVMMLISVMGKTEAAVGGIGWAVLIVMAMTGGGMLPLAMMPSWMQSVSDFSFVKWTVLSIEGAIWRNFSFQEMLKPCAILIGIGLAGFFTGARIFKASMD